MAIDVTDATFEEEVIERSRTVPVVVDLWAPWCGPCKTLGPILERVVDETDGAVVLAKIDIDQNPEASARFRVQSIPAVYGLRDGRPVDGFVGARDERGVREFIERLQPDETELELKALLGAGDETSLRTALDLRPDHADAIQALATVLVDDGRHDEALELLGRVPETAQTRQLAARARSGDAVEGDITEALDDLLLQVKGDDDARQRYVDLLEVLGPDDPRTTDYRRRLAAQLY